MAVIVRRSPRRPSTYHGGGTGWLIGLNFRDVWAAKIAMENKLLYIAQDSPNKIEFSSILFQIPDKLF